MTRSVPKRDATPTIGRRSGMVKHLNCYIDAQLHNELRLVSAHQGASMQSLVEEAIRRFLPELEKGGPRP